MSDANEVSVSAGKRQCVRIEKNGARATDLRDDDVVDLWIRFNRDFRPASALFVDGSCRNTGIFTETECKELAEALAA